MSIFSLHIIYLSLHFNVNTIKLKTVNIFRKGRIKILEVLKFRLKTLYLDLAYVLRVKVEVLEEISVDDWRVGGGRTEPHLTRHTDRTTRSDETPSTISLLSFQYTTEHPEPEVFSLYIVR